MSTVEHVQTIEESATNVDQNVIAEGERKAAKIVRKHRREIRRLQQVAEKAIIEGNRESYVYAIGKLRDIYRQPYNEGMLHVMYETTRQTVLSML